MQAIELKTNQRFERLKVIREAPKGKYGHTQYYCKCDCGKEVTVLANLLTRGKVRSCGCYRDEIRGTSRRKGIVWTEEPCQYPELGNCFICTSHFISKEGYPQICRNGKQMRMSKFMYEQKFGQIPKDICVCHKCDNPPCINPEHFFLGTRKDNAQDMLQKGRNKYGIHGKLSKEQVIKIYSDNRSNRKIARDYGVSSAAICDIKNKKSWREILIAQ